MKRVLVLCSLMAILCEVAQAQVSLICRLKPGVDGPMIATRYGIAYLDRTSGAPFFLFQAADEAKAHAVQDAMLTDPQVVWAEDDGELTSPENEGLKSDLNKGSTLPAVGGRDKLYSENTRLLKQIRFLPELATSPGREVRVAILDTGLSPKLDYLWEQVLYNANFIEPTRRAYDVPRLHDTNGNGIFDEGVGHGSMVAAVVDQMAPQAKLVVARVADSDGVATGWTVIKGLAFAVTRGCEVANISLGSLERIPALSDTMDWCEARGLLVVAPIGNHGLRAVTYPADISKVLCVAGLNPNSTKASFSNWEGETDFSAPATGVAGAWWDGSWATWSGTSFASPVVAGIISDCLRRTTQRLYPLDIRQRLRNAGRGLNALNPSYEDELGTLVDHGRFNARINPSMTP